VALCVSDSWNIQVMIVTSLKVVNFSGGTTNKTNMSLLTRSELVRTVTSVGVPGISYLQDYVLMTRSVYEHVFTVNSLRIVARLKNGRG
jgi:hypothetical protein